MSGYTDLTKMKNSRSCLRRIAHHDEPQFSKNSIVNMMEKFEKTMGIMDDTILIPCRLMDRQVGDSTDIIPTPGKDSTSNQHTYNSSAYGKRNAANSKNVHEFLNNSDLFTMYNMLNATLNLLWTGKDSTEDEEDEQDKEKSKSSLSTVDSVAMEPKTEMILNTDAAATNINSTNTTISTGKGHVRRPSTASVASTASVSNLSDTDSDISNENDSGVESEGNKSDPQSTAGSISSSDDVCTQKKGANVDKATELAKRCRKHLTGLYQCLEQMTEAANYLTARYQSDIGPV